MNDAGCEVVVTRDGARAMLDRGTGEVMHPVVGPRVEAATLYLEPSRLEERLDAPVDERAADALVLLDVGLGAGSNAIAAWRASEGRRLAARRLEIVSFDRTLAAFELARRPENAAAFALDGEASVAALELATTRRHETTRTSWRLHLGDAIDALATEDAARADVVFWDPFSPRATPELWSLGAFRALRRVCRGGATVHTYSGATAVRSALLLAGFAVGIGPRTGDHKHATVAAVDVHDLTQPLDRRWLDRLARSSVPFPADAPSDALARVRALAQFA